MKTITSVASLQRYMQRLRRKGRRIGFVPTMGALHEGHLSLVRRARRDNDIVVVSIFVNPLQFGPQEDFGKYPRDLKKDMRLLRGFCDVLFLPGTRFVPGDMKTSVAVKDVSAPLCGASRPGHFTGVATIVAKLLLAVGPDRLYVGQKDAQQAVVIRRMIEDLNFPVAVVVCPIVRAKDGLAMSSRNAYLSTEERHRAVILYQALKAAQRMAAGGTRESMKIIRVLEDLFHRVPGTRIDYLEVVDRRTLEPVRAIEKTALLALAIYVGDTRLIDNTVLKIK
ncbi:MAG: pantoate--beta-alanine ligase [Deltaproteobacteria bacterium]